jgi:hypothetical protein
MTFEQSLSDELLLAQLTDEQVQQVKKQCISAFDDGKRARAEKEEIWARCWKAYTMYKDKRLFSKQPWRTQIIVSWIYDTVESAVDDQMEVLFPNEEDFFSILPTVPGDKVQEKNAECMTGYLQSKLDEAEFIHNFKLFLKQLNITGSSVMKCYWKTSQRVVSKSQFLPSPDPVTGASNIRTRTLVTDYDAPYAETVQMQDFVLFPAVGDVDKAMCVHRILRPLDQVKNNPVYVNVEDLRADTTNTSSATDRQLGDQINTALGITDNVGQDQKLVELLEVWGDFILDGTRYSNYVAVVAKNQSKLLRFEPNPYDYGLKPFVFCGFRDVPGQVYAIGIVEPVLDYQAMGSTISNMIFDEAKLKIHGQFKYVPDGVFDPDSFEARPGAAHPVGEIDNLQAINPNLNLSFGFAERNNLKGEMEECTGVTQFSKGANAAGKSRTARESVLMAQAGTKKSATIAKHINRKALIPCLRQFYMLVKQFEDPMKIMEQTELQLMELAAMGPLDKTKFKVTGLTTTLHKQTVIENFNDFVGAVLPTPAAQMLNWGALVEAYYKALGFKDTENLLLPEQLRNIIQELMIAQAIGMMPPPGVLGGQAPSQNPSGASVGQEMPPAGQAAGDASQNINQGGNSMISGII